MFINNMNEYDKIFVNNMNDRRAPHNDSDQSQQVW